MGSVTAGSKSGVDYDARGLAEPDAVAPETAEIDGTSAVLDCADLSTRQINLEIRRLVYELAVTDVTLNNPGSKHSIGVGILKRCKIHVTGSPGWFAFGLIDGPEVRIDGRVGWSCAENMMSGSVVIEAALARSPELRSAAATWSSRAMSVLAPALT